MILDDPQALHLGAWTPVAFALFCLITFVGIPLLMVLVLVALWRLHPVAGTLCLAGFISFMISTEVNVHILQFYFQQAAWRPYLLVVLCLFLLVPILLFRRTVIRILQLCSAASIVLFVHFAFTAAPQQDAKGYAPSAVVSEGQFPIFIFTFEKLVSSYLADAQGKVLEEHFPNLAAFAAQADCYPNAFANSTATIYALKTLYTGRLWTKERDWAESANLRDLLGANRRVYMLLDILGEYARPPAVQIRTLGQEGLRSRDLIVDWYKTYLAAVLPDPVEDIWGPRLNLPTFNTMWDLWNRESVCAPPGVPPARHLGIRQFDRLIEIVQVEQAAPHLYIMHNFISDEPKVQGSLMNGSADEPKRFADLKSARENLVHFDQQLGRFMDALKSVGAYDESLILITSDTGYDVGAKGVTGESEIPASDDLLRIFLAIKGPRQPTGRIISTAMRQIDVLPTLLEHVGIDPRAYAFEGVATTNPADTTDVSGRPVDFTVTSQLGGILHYRLDSPSGPLRRVAAKPHRRR